MGYRAEFVADLGLLYEPDYQLSIPGQFPALADLIARDYEETARIGGWHVFAPHSRTHATAISAPLR